MKQFFTSLLLLGAVTATQAQVTVTAYNAENKSVTINFTYDGSRPTPEKVVAAIKTAFEGENATIAKLPKPEREKITTVKLTGDWNNVDLDPTSYNPGGVFGNLSINKIVNEFTDPRKEFLVTLDLSECQGFESKYQGVRDTRKALDENGNVYGDEIEIAANESSEGYIKEWLETYFTSLPVPQAGSSTTEERSKPVTITQHSSTVTVSYDTNPVTVIDNPVTIVVDETGVTYINNPVKVGEGWKYSFRNNSCDPENNILPPYVNDDAYFEKKEDGWHIIIPSWSTDELLDKELVTTYTYYTNADNNSGETTQYDTNGLRQDDSNNWWYTRYEYTENGTLVSNQTPEGLTQNADGTWKKVFSTSYTYYTNAENNDGQVSQNDTNGLREDNEGNWWYTRYLYQNQNGENIVADNTNDLTPNPDGEGWVFVKATLYTYYDETGNEVTKRNDTSSITSDGNGGWVYNYVTYDYEDENGNQISATNVYDPHALTSDGEGGYTYNYKVTIVTDPVCQFAIDKEIFLGGIIFPVSDNFTFIPNSLFKDNETIKKAVLSNKIVAIGNKAFGSATHLEEVNFPASIQEIGYGAFKKTKITEAKLAACTNLSRIRFETFQECANLSVATFPTKIREIQKEAYEKCPLVDIDLSQCHDLEMLAGKCFDNTGTNTIETVTLCSHPKIIRGTSVRNGGDSNGAFHEAKKIKKVEVVGCANTCVTECVCENRAFEWDITHNQTGAPEDIYEKVAELIYPKDLPACANSGYTSSYDFFVGDYKAGTLMMQETLLGYHRQIPNTGKGEGKFFWYEEDQNGQMSLKDEVRPISADDRYIGNGWLEFVLTGATQYVPKGEFLRTYSRTAGDGPLKLPKEVTAYRAVDYKTDQFAYVLDRQGKYFYDATVVSENEDDKYKLIDGIDGTEPDDVISAAELAIIGNSKRYSHLTIGGKLFLRPLVAKVAEYPGIEGGYTGDNIALFDREDIYSQLANVPGGISYVPEGTGVVLYSEIVAKDAVFMLGGDFGTGTVYKKFPHTGNRYEEARGANEANDINMLQGSYGTGWPVAPVFPWVYNDEDACKGGHYSKTEPKAYRNFACVMTHEGETLEGGLAVRNSYGWKRLQPSKLKVNRAFAQIPVSRFDNFNEDADLEQFPGFTIEDTTADVPEVDNEGTETSGNANLMLISIFEGQSEDGAVVDGIEEVKTVDNVVAKKENNAWYTLQGVRVSNLTKGIYIHNGKKVVIK